MMTAPACDRRSMFSRWMVEKGVSRTTRISLRRSLSATSAARSIRSSQIPLATEARVPVVQGQMTTASGGFEPLATGAVHCWRPNTCNCPGRAEKCAREIALHLTGLPGQLEIGLHVDHDLRGLRDHQVDATIGGQQAFDQAQAVLDTGGAGEGDGDR